MAAPYNFIYKPDSEQPVASLPSVSGYNHDQLTGSAVPREPHDGSSATCNTSTSSCAPASESHGYNNYGYENFTNSYGYGNTGYGHYYHGYQQQGTASYTQQAGTHQDTGSYQHLNSFPHANNSVGPSSYSSTHYDPALYQATGGYPNSGYNHQSGLWSSGSYGNYAYPSYGSADSNGIHTSNNGGINHHQYQHQNDPWGTNYYSQTAPDVCCAPGTESISVTSTPPMQPPVPGRGSEYAMAGSQPVPPGTVSSWKPVSYYPEVPVQMNSAAIENHHQSWKSEPSGFQNQYQNSVPSYIQKPQESNQMQYESQCKAAFPPPPPSQYAPSCEIAQSVQLSMLTPVADTGRANRFQIPTNTRIASSFSVSMPRSDRETVSSETAPKPAYVSVSLPKANDRAASSDMANAVLKPGTFPPSLCSYVERALARCKDDSQKISSQYIMKEMITKASADGTLFTKNWDMEPLFALPDVIKASEKDNLRSPLTLNFKRSPTRRSKSRWEPLPQEKLVEKLAQANQEQSKTAWNGLKESETVSSVTKCGKKDNVWGGSKLSSALQQSFQQKDANRPEKKQRLVDSTTGVEPLDNSSDSDKESSLTAYYSGALALANSPEEKKKRENRFKRFETVQDHGSASRQFKHKAAGAGHSFGRRATTVALAGSHVESSSRAVEDIDWDALTVKGACQEIEKRYLRLTSAPDPATVRPEEVLVKALEMVQSSQKNYLYKCDQLKSIRQDLTVQRIQNELTVKVYETHARLALEAGDLPEFNQCQSQLMGLYSEGIEGSYLEFSAYNLLCAILHANNNRDLLSLMARLSLEAKRDNAVKHALAVRAAVTSGNYVTFFRLYKAAPNLSTCLMDLYVEKMRFEAVRCMSRAYRPTVPVSFIFRILGFTSASAAEGEETEGFLECEEWLKSHGANLVTDQNGELALDAKATASSLFMPEPEDAVAHGDATLAVNDFLTRTQ